MFVIPNGAGDFPKTEVVSEIPASALVSVEIIKEAASSLVRIIEALADGGALAAFLSGLPWESGFVLLCAYAAAAVALGPLAMAAACRNALS